MVIPPSTFKVIAKAIAGEPHLLPTPDGCLQFSYEDGLAVVVLDDNDRPVGYSRLQVILGCGHPDGGWYELGSTWVHPQHRGNGVNLQMYRLLLPLHTEKNILATTTNGASIHVGEQIGLVVIGRKELREKVWQASCCCPCSKTGASKPKNEDCQLAHGEPQKRTGVPSCWFRVTPQTAERLNLVSALAS